MTEETKKVPILYCDIDGTIRWGKDELGRFVNTAADVRVFDEVPELLAAYKKLGWRIVGVSNQGGIGLGYMPVADCVDAMKETQRQCGMLFDKLIYCPHKPSLGCPCRKPQAGMVYNARYALFELYHESYPFEIALFTGDRGEDEACADTAGIRFMHAEDWRDRVHLNELLAAKGN
jgi:D-glycero-D-manno-heptose 1,7-bisphosphate phosphatase